MYHKRKVSISPSTQDVMEHKINIKVEPSAYDDVMDITSISDEL